METVEMLLTLSLIPGLGCRILPRLLRHFGSPQAILSAKTSKLGQVRGIGPKLIDALCRPPWKEAKAVIDMCHKAGIRIMSFVDEDYPVHLLKIPDPPVILYLQGEILPKDQESIAIVGTRRCTFYGLSQAERLAKDLAEVGITVVSGLLAVSIRLGCFISFFPWLFFSRFSSLSSIAGKYTR